MSAPFEPVATGPSGPAEPSPSRPLDGVLVVDLGRYLPAPLLTRLLADLGARVLKIEEPKLGDPVRQAPPAVEGRSSLAALLLSGHESLSIDLKKPGAKAVVEDLLLGADVLVESFRPGSLAALGLAPEALRRLYPKLIVCSITGWGQDGPHAHRAGHDLGYQAIAGTLAAGAGMPGVQVADVIGAWSAATAVCAALHQRHSTGRGTWIDQSLLDAASHAGLTAWAAEADGAKAVGEPLYLTGALACYDLYRTRDGATFAVALLEPRFWKRFCDAVGRRDLLMRQLSRGPEVRRRMKALFEERTRAEWTAFFAEHDLPGEAVLSPSEALAHPQVVHRGVLRRAADGLLRLGFPARFDGVRPRGGEVFPSLGQHTDPVLEELGIATGLSARDKRKAGVGQRFSWRRLASRVATAVASRGARQGAGSDLGDAPVVPQGPLASPGSASPDPASPDPASPGPDTRRSPASDPPAD